MLLHAVVKIIKMARLGNGKGDPKGMGNVQKRGKEEKGAWMSKHQGRCREQQGKSFRCHNEQTNNILWK